MMDFDGDGGTRFMRRFTDRWCYLGGGSTTQTTKNETDPQLKALMLSNYSTAQGVADTPFQAYTGQRVAPTNPTQAAGQAGLLTAVNDPTATNTLNTAVGGVGGLLSYQPQNIAAPATVNAGQLSNTDLTPYMNPFQKDVIDASVSQNEYARNVAQMHDSQAATHAGSFQGAGTRQGVAMGETNAGYDRNNQQNLAELNSANFGQARSAASTDISNRMNADQFNATGGYNAGVANAANDITGANFRLNAGTTLAGLSNQQLQDALTRAGVINAVGDQQHSQQQDQNDAAYEEFMRQIQYPQQQQSIRNAAIGLLPNDGTQTGTATKKYGLGDFLMAGISGASKAAAGGAFG